MNMTERLMLSQAILDRLEKVIDPETGVDVVRMRLVDQLSVDEEGRVTYVFRPSSPLCPIAVTLIQQIKAGVAEVEGVNGQRIQVVDYVNANALTKLINEEA